jgi:hypothetical protein
MYQRRTESAPEDRFPLRHLFEPCDTLLQQPTYYTYAGIWLTSTLGRKYQAARWKLVMSMSAQESSCRLQLD